ncbi:uncharacterized protein LOC121637917 [Melanotaenia boesemani]|uniref:uncharacterized protein LOC121637917 n=1 Tax=Melanotaenia boesemani TaxID=1250792 RepID=UPI001C04A7EB|nr:uncharacterized protein LOC121637917 [Melanotaenia boesemani]XP_041838196.1 uncharacterized protein LOC121637917 [Melanotaenia boesemani]
MATNPMTWQDQGTVTLLNRLQDEDTKTINHWSSLRDNKAPKAMPEDDFDILEFGADVQAPQDNYTSTAIILENQESPDISQGIPKEIQGIVMESEEVSKFGKLPGQEEPEEPVDLYQDAFPSPPSTDALSTGEYCEKEVLSSLEGEITEWISDAEVISESSEDLISFNTQKSQVDQQVATILEDTLTAEGSVDSTSDSNNLNYVNTANSPPFADKSEEEDVGNDAISYPQPGNTSDMSCKAPSSASKELCSALHAFPSARHEEELLLQSQHDLNPRRIHQEAEQQVLSQGSPPVSTVAMELTGQGGATSQGCGCVAAVRGRCSRVGERTEGIKEQTGREEGQKQSGLEKIQPDRLPHSRGLLGYSPTEGIKTEKSSSGKSLKQSRYSRMESDMFDDSQSDSGVSADFSPYSTLESNTTTIFTSSLGTVSTETPIEREIRRTIEREHSLRRSRGLPNPATSPEYVDVPLRKTVLSQSLNSKSGWSQDKDRDFAGKKMQHEIHKETRREQDLVKIGRIPGFYDKGTVRQIKERKQIFETFQTPEDSNFFNSVKSKTTSWFSHNSDVSSLENQEDVTSTASTLGDSSVERRRSIDLLDFTQSPKPTRGSLTESTFCRPSLSEKTCQQIIIIENKLSVPAQKRSPAEAETGDVTAVVSGNLYMAGKHEKEEEEASKENPFFKLRTSTNLEKVKQDILEAQEREKELHTQRLSLYGGRGRPISLEGNSSILLSSKEGLTVPDIPESSSKGGSRPTSGRQSVNKLYVWPPVQGEVAEINQPEVLQSPRTPRQRTSLVQRWESGLINGYSLEDD